ncbi:MAG: hypothetical protein IJP00_02450 [Firmicutes bacterium]|nr:hypothetical protein [Bacillota bacterium]
MSIKVTGNVSQEEQQAYIDYLESKYQRKLKSLDIKVDDEFADLNYEFEQVPFERIRRITGYLVGTMEQWNDAKAAEEHDRVKHDVSTPMERI